MFEENSLTDSPQSEKKRIEGLDQACKIQTTSRAEKAPKTAKGAAEMRKSAEWATFH